LRDPGRLQVVEVVEDQPRDRQRAQVIDTGRFATTELGVLRLIAPRNERREPPGLVLHVTQAEQVLQPFVRRFHRSVHHRRRRPQPGAVCVSHDVEPFVRARLAVAVQDLADAIDEDLGAAAGDAIEAHFNEPIDDLGDGEPRQSGQMDDFRRRERVEPERRIARLDGPEQILVPLEREIRIVATLEEELSAAERDRLVDFAEDLLERENVAFAGTDGAIERTEVTPRNADVRVVDVAVDDVGDDTFGMFLRAHSVGKLPEQRRRRVQIQLERFGPIQPSAVTNLCRQSFEHRPQQG
jgi:hypothetical protein